MPTLRIILYFCLVSTLDLTGLLPYLVETLVCMNTTIHIFEKSIIVYLKYAKLHGSSWVSLCMNPLRAESWFPTALSSPGCKPHRLGFPYHLLLFAPGMWVLTRPRLCPSYPSQRGLSLFLSYRKSVLLVFRSFSEVVVLRIVVVLVCPWEVKSGSFYSTIYIQNQTLSKI